MESQQQAIEQSQYLEESFFAELIQSFKQNKSALVGSIVLVLFISAAVLAPFIAPYDPYNVDMSQQFQRPSAQYLLGTDMFGRDILSRIIYGSRISLVIGLIPTLISMVIGTILGLVAGYYGKKTDYIIMRLADIVMAFPSLLLAMVVMYTLGASLLNIFIAISMVNWAGTARVVRSQTLVLKEKEFVEAAKIMGVKNWVILLRHLFPNCIPSLLVLFTLGIPDAIMSEATLSFLGVGVQPPMASWGLMVSTGKEFLFMAPWVAIVPGVAILIVALAFNFLGDGLRDALDPYLKQ
ncbi:MAG: putative permease component of transporter [Firmicutes bacterium]|nr:putative permease component of transporter [Bacillota bacterium]